MTNANSWDADWEVSEQLARTVIYGQFPDLTSLPIELLDSGWDNVVFRVGDDYVFRFPKRHVSVELIIKEGMLLPKLAESMTLPYPKPLFYGEPCGDYPLPFLGYAYVSGKFPAGLSDERRALSAAVLGRFLKKLHAFPVQMARENGIEDDHRNLTDIALRLEKMRTFLSDLTPHIAEEDRRLIADFLESTTLDRVHSREVLLHGDLHFKNMLVDDDGLVAGVIDWGDISIGHPGGDLNVVYSFLPPQARLHFFQEYGEVDDETKLLARLMAVYIPMLLWLQAIDGKNDKMAEEARATIRRAITEE